MIQRICDLKDMRNDPRINFEEFKRLTFKAMKTRSRKKHIALLFKIMDQDNTGRVHAHNLCRVSSQIQEEPLTMQKAKKTVRNCSQNSQFITGEEFMYIIKQAKKPAQKPAEEDLRVDDAEIDGPFKPILSLQPTLSVHNEASMERSSSSNPLETSLDEPERSKSNALVYQDSSKLRGSQPDERAFELVTQLHSKYMQSQSQINGVKKHRYNRGHQTNSLTNSLPTTAVHSYLTDQNKSPSKVSAQNESRKNSKRNLIHILSGTSLGGEDQE